MMRFQYEGQPLIFPQEIVHEEGTKQRISLRTAIEIDFPEEAAPLYQWNVVKADNPKENLQWHSGRHRMMLVPPGKYRLVLRQFQFSGDPMVWPQEIEIQEDQHVVVGLTSFVRLEMPKEAGPLDRWDIIQAGQPKQVVQWHQGNDRVMVVPPGKYQVVLRPYRFSGESLLWPQEIEVQEGQHIPVRIASHISLEMPKEAGPLDRWDVVQAGQPKKMVQWHEGGNRVMVVAPGKYQVVLQPYRFSGQQLLWPEEFEVKKDQQTPVRIGSFVKLEMSKEAGPLYRWDVIDAGQPKKVVQWHEGDNRVMVMPPGKYQVVLQPYHFSGQQLLWPEEFEVKKDQQTPVRIGSFVKLEMPKEAGPLDRWDVIDAGQPKKMVQWHEGGNRVMVLPPGKYQVVLQPYRFSGQQLLWPEELEVKKDQQTPVRIGSFVKLEMPKEAGPLDRWDVIDAGQPKKMVQWHEGGNRVMVLPPGKYQVVLQPYRFSGQQLVWPQEFEVKKDQQTPVNVASFIKLEMPKDAAPLYLWEISEAGQPKKIVQWHNGDNRVMVVPPGKYQAMLRPFQFRDEQTALAQRNRSGGRQIRRPESRHRPAHSGAAGCQTGVRFSNCRSGQENDGPGAQPDLGCAAFAAWRLPRRDPLQWNQPVASLGRRRPGGSRPYHGGENAGITGQEMIYRSNIVLRKLTVAGPISRRKNTGT